MGLPGSLVMELHQAPAQTQTKSKTNLRPKKLTVRVHGWSGTRMYLDAPSASLGFQTKVGLIQPRDGTWGWRSRTLPSHRSRQRRARPGGVCRAAGPPGGNSVGVFTFWKANADTVSAATEFHLAEEPVLIHQASPTLPRLHSGLCTQTETTRCRYTYAPRSFLQAAFIIQHVFTAEQQIVSGVTRQEHVFGYGVLPAKPGTRSAVLWSGTLKAAAKTAMQLMALLKKGRWESLRLSRLGSKTKMMRGHIIESFCRADIPSPP